MSLIVLLIFLIPLGLSAALIFHGIRGYRVGDHPVCRRCGYDLFGLPAETAVCGECGTGLRRRNAVVVGHRRVRRASLGIGTILFIFASSVIGGLGYGRAKHVNGWTATPLWYVLREASSTDPSWRTPALAELARRYKNHLFSAAQTDRIVVAGLVYQHDVARPWEFGWGDLIETMHADGKLPPEKWTQYLSQAVDGIFSFQPRKIVRRGDPLPYQVLQAQPRASRNNLMVTISNQTLVWSSSGRVIKTYSQGGENTRPFAMGPQDDGGCIDPLNIPKSVADGPQALRLRQRVVIITMSRLGQLVPEYTRDIDIESPFTLIPANQSSVKLIHNPSLKAAILKSMTLDTHSSRGSNSSGPFKGFDFHVQNGPPVGLAFDVFVKMDGTESRIGSISFAANEAHGTIIAGKGVDVPWPKGKVVTVDVILRANPAAGAATVDTFECWDGELIFRDVLVK